MKINFINDEEIKNKLSRGYSPFDKILDKWFHIKDEFRYNKKVFFLNLFRGKLPRHNFLGLFSHPESVNVNLEGINRYHGVIEESLIKKITEVLIHEVLHHEIYSINKMLTTKQEHWAIKKMGY